MISVHHVRALILCYPVPPPFNLPVLFMQYFVYSPLVLLYKRVCMPMCKPQELKSEEQGISRSGGVLLHEPTHRRLRNEQVEMKQHLASLSTPA